MTNPTSPACMGEGLIYEHAGCQELEGRVCSCSGGAAASHLVAVPRIAAHGELASLLIGYDLRDPGMSPPDREVLEERLQRRWSAILAAAGATAAAPQPAAQRKPLTDEQIERIVGQQPERINRAMTITRWKDGIDCDYLTQEAVNLIRAIEAAHGIAEQPAAQGEPSDLEKRLADAEQSRDWYKRRVDLLQQVQSRMRDPERTMVCDVLANGALLPDSHAGARYSVAAQGEQSVAPKLTGCACRWDGDSYVEKCELHEAWHTAIHEWAERAKGAEAKLAAQGKPQGAAQAVAGRFRVTGGADGWQASHETSYGTTSYCAIRDGGEVVALAVVRDPEPWSKPDPRPMALRIAAALNATPTPAEDGRHAARYRWLRDNFIRVTVMPDAKFWQFVGAVPDNVQMGLDAAIDAARKGGA